MVRTAGPPTPFGPIVRLLDNPFRSDVMYDIRQFKPALYALVLFGITGFAMASQSPGVWVLGGGAVLVNGWAGVGRPVPSRCRGWWRTG